MIFFKNIGRRLIDLYNISRYRKLKEDGKLASIYRRIALFSYPIINNRFILNSRIFNINNREKQTIYEQLCNVNGGG